MTTTIDRARALAGEMATAFTTKTRANGEAFRLLKDDPPEWMTDVVREAHDGMMPDDHRYRMIERVCDTLAESEDWDDLVTDLDGLVDIYTSHLTTWLASHIDRVGYCDDAVEDIGREYRDTANLLQWGQLREYEEIAASLINSFRTRAEEGGGDDA